MKQEKSNLIRTNLYLSHEERKALKKAAKVLGVSSAELLRRIVDTHFGLEASVNCE
jgi:hypothetical protein